MRTGFVHMNMLVLREDAFTLVSQETLACTTEIPETFLYVYEGDQLISYNGKVCDYTPIGCKDTYLGKAMDWNQDGRFMACYTRGEQVITFTYDSHGRRVSKSIYEGTPTNFIYNKDGNLIYQSSGEDTIRFLYDHTGVMGMAYKGAIYIFRKNAQGDMIAIDNGANKPMVEYIYDAWGNHEIRINAPLDSDGDEVKYNNGMERH